MKRHAPPKHLPPLQQDDKECESSKPDEYLEIAHHDYASLDEVGFISSSPGVEGKFYVGVYTGDTTVSLKCPITLK